MVWNASGPETNQIQRAPDCLHFSTSRIPDAQDALKPVYSGSLLRAGIAQPAAARNAQ